MIVNRWKQDADANKGYIVFTKYQNIGKKQYVPEDYIIQNASVCLRKFRSEKMWKDTLKEYKKDELPHHATFSIIPALKKRSTPHVYSYNRI